MTEKPIKRTSYKDAGVDIDAGAALVEAIGPLARATQRPGAEAELGGFGAAFDLKASGFKDPILVAATDGVGSKVKLASTIGRYDTVGIDLVAMCVNDLVTEGAEPLFFLDYFSTGALDVATATEIVGGISAGCKMAGCALIGGETAEMPGLYGKGDFDLAGFAVGAAERGSLITGNLIAAGDVVLGLASAGLHANGFSLVRKIVADAGLDYDTDAPFQLGHGLGEVLLTPTRIYVKSVLGAIKAGGVKGLAHITGGGLVDNIPRVLPEGLGVTLDAASWPCPDIFKWLAAEGGVEAADMARTFNCGIGMVVITAPNEADRLRRVLQEGGETVWTIGAVRDRPGDGARCRIEAMETAWRG